MKKVEIKLKEMEFKGNMKYLFENSSNYPLSKADYRELSHKGELFYNKPFDRNDEYYGEEWLLIGEQANYLGRYFFSEEGFQRLQVKGYDVSVYTLQKQKEDADRRKKKEQKRMKLHAIARNIFKFIQENGIYPEPNAEPEGIKIETPYYPHNIYGGGHWFVIEKNRIWAIQNNGSDGDCWAWNNVATGGAGAIGYYIPYESKIEDLIRLSVKSINEIDDEQLEEISKEIKEGDLKIKKGV